MPVVGCPPSSAHSAQTDDGVARPPVPVGTPVDRSLNAVTFIGTTRSTRVAEILQQSPTGLWGAAVERRSVTTGTPTSAGGAGPHCPALGEPAVSPTTSGRSSASTPRAESESASSSWTAEGVTVARQPFAAPCDAGPGEAGDVQCPAAAASSACDEGSGGGRGHWRIESVVFDPTGSESTRTVPPSSPEEGVTSRSGSRGPALAGASPLTLRVSSNTTLPPLVRAPGSVAAPSPASQAAAVVGTPPSSSRRSQTAADAAASTAPAPAPSSVTSEASTPRGHGASGNLKPRGVGASLLPPVASRGQVAPSAGSVVQRPTGALPGAVSRSLVSFRGVLPP